MIAIHWDGRSILNEDGLRFDDEFVRHKLLDLIGDMVLLGGPVLGHVVANRSGHSLHLDLMQAIVDNPTCWEYVKYQRRGTGTHRKAIRETRTAGSRLPLFLSKRSDAVLPRAACAA